MTKKNREPSCVLNHDVMRRELRDKKMPAQPCPECDWLIYPAQEIREEIPTLSTEEFKKKVEELCEQYASSFGICVVIEQNVGDYHITGNLCPVCARDVLAGYVLKYGIQHNKHVH